MVDYVNGAKLPPALQRDARARYVHRFTGDNRPSWTRELRPCGRSYPLQFQNDSDWLANTDFPITKAGALANRPNHCQSRPTWPNGRA